MSDYGYKKGPCGTRHPLFLSSGYVYFWSVSKERCLLWNVLGSVPIRVSAFCPPLDTYDLCVMCLGEEHVRFVHEGTECVHCERFSLKKLRSHLSLFSREFGKSSAPCGSVPAVAEAARRLRSWGLQMEFADDIERGVYLSCSVAADEGELLEEDVLSLTSSDPAGSDICLFAFKVIWILYFFSEYVITLK